MIITKRNNRPLRPNWKRLILIYLFHGSNRLPVCSFYFHYTRFHPVCQGADRIFCVFLAWQFSAGCSIITIRVHWNGYIICIRRSNPAPGREWLRWLGWSFLLCAMLYERAYLTSGRMQIAQSDFLRDERKNGENPLWIFEYFPKISQKICKQDACEKMPNRLYFHFDFAKPQ